MATVEFQDSDNDWQEFHLKIDSGAVVTLLNRGECELLKYKLEDGEREKLSVANDSSIYVRIHQIKLKIGNVTLPNPVRIAFAETKVPALLLGRLDIFEFFDITLRERIKQINFSYIAQ